jgi:hypothetical protein
MIETIVVCHRCDSICVHHQLYSLIYIRLINMKILAVILAALVLVTVAKDPVTVSVLVEAE